MTLKPRIFKRSFLAIALCFCVFILCTGCTGLKSDEKKEIETKVELTLATMDYSNFTRVALH